MACIPFLSLIVDTLTLGVLFLTLVVLSITMFFVILYWSETQRMKEEMINQNKISFQNIKIQNMPLIDIQLQDVKYNYNKTIPQQQMQFPYEIFLINKGNGPAFNIITTRYLTPEENAQQRVILKQDQKKIQPFVKKTKMVGVSDKIKIRRESSCSTESWKIEVSYEDYFRERHKIVFRGNIHNIEISEYPHMKNFYT